MNHVAYSHFAFFQKANILPYLFQFYCLFQYFRLNNSNHHRPIDIKYVDVKSTILVQRTTREGERDRKNRHSSARRIVIVKLVLLLQLYRLLLYARIGKRLIRFNYSGAAIAVCAHSDYFKPFSFTKLFYNKIQFSVLISGIFELYGKYFLIFLSTFHNFHKIEAIIE